MTTKTTRTRIACPDCDASLPGDGSCCDVCGWTLKGGGDDPRLPSGRSRDAIERTKQNIARRRAVDRLRDAGFAMRQTIAAIGNFPDTRFNQKLHREANEVEERVRELERIIVDQG